MIRSPVDPTRQTIRRVLGTPLVGGVVQGGLPASPGAPQTAVGFSNDGRTMYLVATEGPRARVAGLDLPDLAQFMHHLGVPDAINLDNGGSTTIVARLPGHGGLTLLNHPADGSERRVANGIGLFAGPPAAAPPPSALRAATLGGEPR